MQDIGFFADIQYADILQLIWSIIDSETDMYIFPLNLIAEIIKFLL